MGKFAKILVDIPVEELDQSFDYRIPEKYKDKIKIGQAVLVPFGRRRLLVLLLVLLRKVQ